MFFSVRILNLAFCFRGLALAGHTVRHNLPTQSAEFRTIAPNFPYYRSPFPVLSFPWSFGKPVSKQRVSSFFGVLSKNLQDSLRYFAAELLRSPPASRRKSSTSVSGWKVWKDRERLARDSGVSKSVQFSTCFPSKQIF